MEAPLNLSDSILSDLCLRRKCLLHFVDQGKLYIDVFLRPFDTEINVVRHGQDQIGIQFIFQLIPGDIDQFRREVNHRFGKLAEQSEIFLVNVVKCPCDQIQVFDFIGGLRKSDPLAYSNQLFPFTINTDCEIVILFLDNSHLCLHLQFSRRSVSFVRKPQK